MHIITRAYWLCLKLKTINTGTRWRSLLRLCAVRRKVVGSIPDGITGIFHLHNPSYHLHVAIDCLEIWVPQPPGT
jgi:hypothetical protein